MARAATSPAIGEKSRITAKNPANGANPSNKLKAKTSVPRQQPRVGKDQARPPGSFSADQVDQSRHPGVPDSFLGHAVMLRNLEIGKARKGLR